jgi:hypothetical protein
VPERDARRSTGLGAGAALVGALALVTPALAQDAPAPTEGADDALVRHALIVGANLGGGSLDPLRYAERDAESFAAVLTELGGFSEDRVTVLYQPSVDELRLALAEHAAIAEQAPDDLFVFYYSGHADGNGLRLDTEVYWFDALKHDIRLVDATARVGVLDACRAGTITRIKGAKVAPSLFAGQDQLAARGEVWLTAASADELAQESEALRGGFFTHYLLSGLRGAAAGRDGLVEVQDLYAYTREKVVLRSAEAGGVQRPHFDFNLAGERGIALTDVRRADAALVLAPDRPGHAWILRVADRAQIAELDVPADRAMTVALPPGRYLVRLRDGDGLVEAHVGLQPQTTARVTAWRPVGLEASTARGEDGDGDLEARIQHYRALSAEFVKELDLHDSPALAGASSLLVPGGGQIYNRRPARGAAYFLSTAALVGGGTLFSFTGPDDRARANVATALGIAVWGASIADAVHDVRRAETVRPRTGFALGWSMGFSPYEAPRMGLLADVTPVPHLTLGIDRLGATFRLGGPWEVFLGSRLILAAEGEVVRPGVFVAQGVRGGQRTLAGPIEIRGVFGAGALVRVYATPRYFLELDGRWEYDQPRHGASVGVGLGVPIGR